MECVALLLQEDRPEFDSPCIRNVCRALWQMTMKGQGSTPALNILIVDDEADIRKTLAVCLESRGHRVIAVSNGKDAQLETDRQVFDFAFVDLRLGTENGLDLIPPILGACPWIKIVVITAYASIDTAVEAMRRGATDYIPKPFTPEQVQLVTDRVATVRTMEQRIVTLKEELGRLHPRVSFTSQHPILGCNARWSSHGKWRHRRRLSCFEVPATFFIANDVDNYFAIIPAMFMLAIPQLATLNIMGLATPGSAILSALTFNAVIIPLLIPIAIKGIKYRPMGADSILRRNLLVYGLGGVIAPFAGIKLTDMALSMTGLY